MRILNLAAGISGRYCKGKDEKIITISYGGYGNTQDKSIDIQPATDEEVNNYILK